MTSLIQPVYATRQANAPIMLGRSRIEIVCDGQRLECNGKAHLRVHPDLRLIICADLSADPGLALRIAFSGKRTKIRYGDSPTEVNVLPTSASSAATKCEIAFLPNPQRLQVWGNRRRRLRSVTFHIMNFPAFRCVTDDSADLFYKATPTQMQRLGRVAFADGDWRIELQELPSTAALAKELQARGGFGITHVGVLRRPNGNSFTAAAAQKALRELHLFLSFARGSWVPLILPVGFDTDGNRVFEDWSVPLGVGWEPRISWFDDHHSESLVALYAGFRALLRDVDMSKAVSDALYWYLRSNRAGAGAGVDSGIILSQAALERIAAAYSAKARLSAGPSAADLLRGVFHDLQLPMAIPKAVSRLYRARRTGAWRDVPEAITRVRNELVHPKAKLRVPVGKVVSEVWQLSQVCIELCILRLSGYRGVYSNRLSARWRGQVENVPWVR
jgi:hypothetical protein